MWPLGRRAGTPVPGGPVGRRIGHAPGAYRSRTAMPPGERDLVAEIYRLTYRTYWAVRDDLLQQAPNVTIAVNRRHAPANTPPTCAITGR